MNVTLTVIDAFGNVGEPVSTTYEKVAKAPSGYSVSVLPTSSVVDGRFRKAREVEVLMENVLQGLGYSMHVTDENGQSITQKGAIGGKTPESSQFFDSVFTVECSFFRIFRVPIEGL